MVDAKNKPEIFRSKLYIYIEDRWHIYETYVRKFISLCVFFFHYYLFSALGMHRWSNQNQKKWYCNLINALPTTLSPSYAFGWYDSGEKKIGWWTKNQNRPEHFFCLLKTSFHHTESYFFSGWHLMAVDGIKLWLTLCMVCMAFFSLWQKMCQWIMNKKDKRLNRKKLSSNLCVCEAGKQK